MTGRTTTLSRRQLNRATLARQLLLERAASPAVAAVARLAGLQAQEPAPPYVGLWTRLVGFARAELHDALHGRELVRATGVRGTLHTVTRADYLAWRTALQPLLTDGLRALGERGKGLDIAATAAAARRHLAGAALTFNQLRPLLVADFPEVNERALGYAARMLVPLVMVPTGDRWSFPRESAFTLADPWLGEPLEPDSSPAPLIRRYLAAFGPATVADFQTWSGLPRMRQAFESLDLVEYADERGRRLYDLPGAELPDPQTPAPVRFLPDFDSVLLAHDDRSRVIADEHRGAVVTRNLRVNAAVLVDGVVAGLWRLERRRGIATLTISAFGRLSRRAQAELGAEGERLAAFVEPDATGFQLVMS